MRHDEREAIALIRESNPIYTNNRTAVRGSAATRHPARPRGVRALVRAPRFVA